MLVLPPTGILGEILPAAGIGFVAAVAGRRPWRRTARTPGPAERIAGGVALAGGFWLTWLLVIGRPPPWPSLRLDVSEWPFWFAILALAAGIALALDRVPSANALPTLLAALVAFLLLRPLGRPVWEMLLVAGLFAGTWIGLDGLANRRPGPAVPLALFLVAAGGAMALAHAHFAKGAVLAGGLAAAAAGVLVADGIFRRTTLAGAGTLVFVVLAGSLWTIGTLYADLPLASALLLGVAPLGAFAGEIPAIRRTGRGLPLLAVLATVLGAVLPAVWLSFSANPGGYP